MKKFLSVLLSAIMIVSCLSMVVFVVNAGGTETKVNDAVLLTATGSSYITSDPGIFTADAGFTGNKVVKLVIKNVGDMSTAYDVKIQGTATGGWVDPDGKAFVNGSKSIAPGAIQSVKLVIPVTNGQVTFNGGTETKGMETLFFRINTTVAGKLVITAIEDDSHNANTVLSTWQKDGNAGSVAEPASVSDYKITSLVNADAEGSNSALVWSTGNSGSVLIVEDPDDATNKVAKFVSSGAGAYGTIAYDITPAVFDKSVNPFTDGDMEGTYIVKFRAKAADGHTGKFNVCFVTNTWSDQLYGQNKYSVPGSTVELTDEWQTFTATVSPDTKFFDVVKYNTDCRVNLRLDGGNAGFKDGAFDYFVDDVSVERAEAIKVKYTAEGTSYRTAYNYTEAQVENGFINAKYYVYNINDHDIKLCIYHQNGWSGITGVDASIVSKTLTIPAKTKMLFDFDLPVTGEAGSYKVGNALISALTMRIQIDAGFMPTGSEFIITNASENVDLGKFAATYVGGTLGASGNTATYVTKSDIPDYALVTPTPVPTETAAATATATATAAPSYVGVKLVAKAASTSQIYAVTRDAGVFKADATFTGTKSVTYTVYNTSDETVHVNIVLSALVDGGWYAQNSGKSAEFAPGEKVDITATIDVANGTATIKSTEVPLDKILLRVNVSFKEDGADIGDSVIIATNGSDDALYGVLQTGFNVEYVTELPTATVATPTPVADKVVSNGDAENGATNWSFIHAGSVSVTADPDDADNNVALFVPVANNQYSSIAFDLGPAIIQNAAEGYKGGGAGTYTVTFRAKAAEGHGGRFDLVINSKAHKNKNTVVKVDGVDFTLPENTYATGSSITMTDEWEEFTATVEITEEMLESIEAMKNSSDPLASSAYIVVFRLDGSGGRAFASERFNYYVDDITVEKEGGDDKEEETPKTPTGIEYEAKGDIDSSGLYFVGKKGAFSMADVKGGELTVKYLVKNSGEEDMNIRFELHALVGGKWVAPAGGETVLIEAGETVWLEYTCEVSDDGKVEISGEDIAISELFVRFDVTNGDGGNEVLKGTKFIIYASGAQYDAIKAITTRPGWGAADVYTAPAETGDVVPYVLIAMVVLSATGLVILNKKREEN